MVRSMEVMTFHLKVWKVCGIWHESNQPIWFSIYGYTVYIIMYLLFPIFIAASIFFTNNFDEIIEILIVFPSTISGLKGLFVVFQQQKLLKLFRYIDQMDLEVLNDTHNKIIHRKLKESTFLVTFFCSEYCLTIVLSFFVAIFSKERTFMWPSWYPFDYEHNSMIYYSLACYQLVASLFVAVLSTSLDIYGSALYKVLGGHLDILGMRLQQLGIPNKYINEQEKELDDSKNIKKCVDYHVLCIRYINYIINYRRYCIELY